MLLHREQVGRMCSAISRTFRSTSVPLMRFNPKVTVTRLSLRQFEHLIRSL
jgi:hypothetical protein